jgi:TolB protein
MTIRRLLNLSLLLLLLGQPAFADIEVRAPGKQLIPLALTSFVPMDGVADPALVKTFSAVLASDLELSGLFELIDPRAFLADARKLGLLSIDVDFAEWRLLGAESLIKGGYSIRGDQLVLEARLYDVGSQRLLNGRRYVGKLTDVRRMAHAFADQILNSLTGELGPFNSRIAYISDRTGHKELYVMEVDGNQPVRLTDHRRIVLNPDFSPNGQELIFTSYRANNPDLYRKELASGQETRTSRQQGLNVGGRYRPDGQAIALTLSKDGDSELYLLGLGGELRKRLTQHWAIDIDPSWSPDGRRIAFVSNRRGNPNIFILDLGSEKVERLTLNGKYNVTPAWSPQGDRIAFSRKEGYFDIYTIRTDGTDERRLTFGPGNKEHPRWSPDGRFLVYSSDENGKKAIFQMRADGTGNRKISEPGGNASHPAWSPRF